MHRNVLEDEFSRGILGPILTGVRDAETISTVLIGKLVHLDIGSEYFAAKACDTFATYKKLFFLKSDP